MHKITREGNHHSINIWSYAFFYIAQLIRIHLHHSGLNVESHHRSIICAQASLVGVHLQLMSFQEGQNLSQVLGVLLPSLIEEDQPIDMHQKAGQLAED